MTTVSGKITHFLGYSTRDNNTINYYTISCSSMLLHNNKQLPSNNSKPSYLSQATEPDTDVCVLLAL